MGKEESDIDKIEGDIKKYNEWGDKLKNAIGYVKTDVDEKISDVDGLYTYFKDTYFYKEVNKEQEKIKNDTKLDVIDLLSRSVKTYIPSQFQSEYVQLKTYIPELTELEFTMESYGNVANRVAKRNHADDINQQLEIFNSLTTQWYNINNYRYRGGQSSNEFIRRYSYIVDIPVEGLTHEIVGHKMEELNKEITRIKSKLKKQREGLAQLKSKREEMIRKLRESGTGSSIKVIARLNELKGKKEGRDSSPIDGIFKHIDDNKLFKSAGDKYVKESNVELFCSYGILRCRLDEIEIYLKQYNSVLDKLKTILGKKEIQDKGGVESFSFFGGENKIIYKIFEKYGLAGNTVGYTDPNRIWKIISETFGSGFYSKKLKFEDFEVLRGKDEAIEVFCTMNKLTSLEKKSFRLALGEIFSEQDKIKKEEQDKLQEKKEKKEKKKQAKQQEKKIKEKLKQDIKNSRDTKEGKQEKLEELDKLDKIKEERETVKEEEEKINKERETKVQRKLKELEERTKTDQLRIDRLRQDKELVLKTMDSSLAELTSYKAGHSELVDQKRKLLIDTVSKLKRKKEIQDKQYAELVLMNERNNSLLSEIKSEEGKITESAKGLREQLLRMQEKEKLYLIERQKYVKRNRELSNKLDKQKKRTLQKKKDRDVETRPIVYVEENKGKRKKSKKKAKVKRKKNKSFTETLKSVLS